MQKDNEAARHPKVYDFATFYNYERGLCFGKENDDLRYHVCVQILFIYHQKFQIGRNFKLDDVERLTRCLGGVCLCGSDHY